MQRETPALKRPCRDITYSLLPPPTPHSCHSRPMSMFDIVPEISFDDDVSIAELARAWAACQHHA